LAADDVGFLEAGHVLDLDDDHGAPAGVLDPVPGSARHFDGGVWLEPPRFGGRVPDDLDALLTLKGVGRKTANLVVTQGFHKPGICVDIHVHRISNRLGYVRTRNPNETETALRARLPRRYWIGYNDLLVSFGQNICQPVSPWCSECPVRLSCARVGVTRSR